MPIYEYECQTCHRHTEKRQKFSDPEITQCPHCGGPLERVLSAPAFSFAGGGWYKDLYSSNKPAASGAAEGKSDTAPGAKSESSSESKPASGESKSANGESKSASSESKAAAAPAPASTPAAPAKS